MDTDEYHNKPKASAVFRVITALAILGCAGVVAYYFVSNPDISEKKDETGKKSIFVNVSTAVLDSYPVKIEVLGQVSPARSAQIKAQVSGKIISVSPKFVPGGHFKAGDVLLRIDPTDYALDIKIKTAVLNQAKAALSLEKGQQEIARQELSFLQKSTGKKINNSDLALRKPQLAQARADVATARANLELAQVRLERTTITAPFNAIITQRNTDLGNVIDMQETLATLISTDEYWIDAEIPAAHLQWLQVPDTKKEISGSKAQVTLNKGRGERIGVLSNFTGVINDKSRMANILISVSDPLSLNAETPENAPPLTLSDYLHVTLWGRDLNNAAKLPLNYIRDKHTIWLERDGKLVIQPVTISYEDRYFAYVSGGLNQGDHIITSNILTPINGMDITVRGENAQEPESK